MRRRTAARFTDPRRPRRSAPLLEQLESRCLYTAALTPEFRVNPDPQGVQQTTVDSQKSVAVDASGRSIVVWSGSGTGDATGIFARRFDAAGNPLGGEFRVNSTIAGAQTAPAVAVSDAGNFVVVWTSPDGVDAGVYAQRFNAAGVAQGAEFRVNVVTAGDQFQPSVAMDSDGDFVVSWTSPGQDGGSGLGVMAQRFNSSGVAQGGQLVVNTQNVDFDQQYSRIAMDAGGNFVVVWQSYVAVTTSTGVYARRYDAAGNPLAEFLVNTAIAGDQWSPSVDMNASGAFVVAWSSFGQDGSTPASGSIYAQRYSAAGMPVGGEFQVSLTAAGEQQYPSVAVDDSGAFVVAWQSAAQDGAGWGIYAREYTAGGVARAGETRMNATTAGDQSAASVAAMPSGDYVAVWSGNGAGDADGVFVRWFRPTGPGVTVTPTTGLTTTEAGGTASFTVVLNSAPVADVTVGLSSSDLTEGTISAASLTFTAANWHVPQTVVVTGVNDAYDDGNIAYTITTAAATSTDANYNGINPANVAVSNTDDDVAGVTVTPTSGLVTTEAGGTATFTVVLDARPTSNVTIGLSSSDATEGTVSAGTLTFTSGNWNVPQTVTVTGVNDATHDGNIGYTIVTAASSSADAPFNGMNAADVSVTNTDNDPGGVSVTPTSGLVTTEAGGTATFSVVLTVASFADVVIGLSSGNGSEGFASAASLTFTTANWNVPQTVTVSGVDDAAFDGPVAYTIITGATSSADAGYEGLAVADVSVTNQDNDTGLRATYYDNIDFTGPSVTRVDPTIDFNWGGGSPAPGIGADTFSARWVGEIQPLYGQTYTFYTTSDDGVRLWIGGALVIDNWTDHSSAVDTRTITLAAGQWYSIRMELYENFGVSAARLEWSSASQARQVVPQVRLRPSNAAPVASNDAYDMAQGDALAVGPAAGVLGNDLDGDGDPLTASLVSGPTRGSLLLNDDGSFSYTPDPKFFGTDSFTYRVGDGLTFSGVATVTIAVNRTAGITIVPTTGLVTTEAGGTATFSVVLDGAPSGPVTVQLLSNGTAEGSLSQSVLTFDASNWNVPQTVTVTGVDDHVRDGDRGYTIAPAVSSADPRYDGLALPSVGVTNQEMPLPPTSEDDSYRVTSGGRLIIADPAGVLANDIDASGRGLSAVLVDGPGRGVVTLRPGGGFEYVPGAGFVGVDQFRYRASDGSLAGEPAVVTIVVEAPAPPPPPGPVPVPPGPGLPVGPEDDDEDDGIPPAPEGEPRGKDDQTPIVAEPHEGPQSDVPAQPPAGRPEGPVAPQRPVGPPDGPPDQPTPQPPTPGGETPLIPVPVVPVVPVVPDVEPVVDLDLPDLELPGSRAASASLTAGLDSMARQIGSRGSGESVSIRAVRHTFVAMTVGYVVWSMRGASLLASLLTSMPLWRSLDPLPILESRAAVRKSRWRWFSRRPPGGEQASGELVE